MCVCGVGGEVNVYHVHEGVWWGGGVGDRHGMGGCWVGWGPNSFHVCGAVMFSGWVVFRGWGHVHIAWRGDVMFLEVVGDEVSEARTTEAFIIS